MEVEHETNRACSSADGICAKLRSAQETCRSKAIGKDGRPLTGAALNSFLKKCANDTCEPKAIGKDGKPLVGAAKASFMKKCASEA
jgi:hypothetical protein